MSCHNSYANWEVGIIIVILQMRKFRLKSLSCPRLCNCKSAAFNHYLIWPVSLPLSWNAPGLPLAACRWGVSSVQLNTNQHLGLCVKKLPKELPEEQCPEPMQGLKFCLFPTARVQNFLGRGHHIRFDIPDKTEHPRQEGSRSSTNKIVIETLN